MEDSSWKIGFWIKAFLIIIVGAAIVDLIFIEVFSFSERWAKTMALGLWGIPMLHYFRKKYEILKALKEIPEKPEKVCIVCRHPYKGGGYSLDECVWCGGRIEDLELTEIKPDYSMAYCNRGMRYELQNQYDKAIMDYTKAIEINPNNAVAYGRRGRSYAMQGQYDKALADLIKSIEIDPNYDEACKALQALQFFLTLKRNKGEKF